MTKEEAIAIIRKEYLCVDRDCDIERSCGKCDLMMPSKEPILEAYKLAIKALEQESVILEQEPVIEPLERLAESASKTAKALERLKEQELIEVEATKLQMAYNQGFEDCRKAVMDLLSEAGKLSLLAMVADLQSVNPQEPKYCDRNICIKNEYNGIGCDECEVTKSQEPKTGHWAHDGSHWKNRFICPECGYKLFDEPTNYCPNCGTRMESEEKND